MSPVTYETVTPKRSDRDYKGLRGLTLATHANQADPPDEKPSYHVQRRFLLKRVRKIS